MTSTTLTVVSSRASELKSLLGDRLPAQVRVQYFQHALAVEGEWLDADLALGEPEALASLLPKMPRLRWVQSTWAGVTPLLEVPRSDYLLSGVKGIFGQTMSEYVLGWLLALNRGVLSHAVARSWQSPPERGLSSLRLGIAGMGSIGSAVAERCAPFFREVVGLNRSGSPVVSCARCHDLTRIEEFATGLDALVLLLPDTPSTTNLVDGAVLERLGEGAVVINAGRGNALDLDAALSALESKRLSALVLDVFVDEPLADADPLWAVPGVYITSHSAAPTDFAALVELFLDNLQRFLDGREPLGLIDFTRGY